SPIGLGQASRRPLISRSAKARCRLPPTTSSASDTRCRATGDRPSIPSSPMPTMDSQRCGRLLTTMPLRVLILGGTTEASALAERIAGDPRLAPILTRTGGFGGVEGFVHFQRSEGVEARVDATLPYGDQMAAHAGVGCKEVG